MRKIVQIILLVTTVVISACNNTEDPFSIATGRVNAEIKDYKINGEAPLSIDYNPDTDSYYINAFIISGDTIEFTLEVLFESTLGADVLIDSIVFDQYNACYLETAKIVEDLSSYENQVASGEVYKKQYKFIYEAPECLPNNKSKKAVNYTIHINITGRPTAQEEIDFGTNYHTDLSIDAFIPTNYVADTFRLYNNFVGKEFDDSTGIGYNLAYQNYEQEINYLYCMYEDNCISTNWWKPVLINLTYDSLFNSDQKIFTPAFSLAHNIRQDKRNDLASPDPDDDDYFTLFSAKQQLFDPIRKHPLAVELNELTQHEDLVVLAPEINMEFFINDTFYLRIIDIKEDGINSYVEFVSYTPYSYYNRYL